MCRIRDRDGQPKLGGHALKVLEEGAQACNPAVDGLGGLGLGEHLIAERQHVRDRDREEPGRFLGPAEAEEADEVHHVLAVGPLGVRRGSPRNPAFEDVGDRAVEAPDLGLDRRRVPADQDRRQLGPRLAHQHQLVDFFSTMTRPLPARSSMLKCPPLLFLALLTTEDNRFYLPPSTNQNRGRGLSSASLFVLSLSRYLSMFCQDICPRL